MPHKNQLHKVLYNSWEATLLMWMRYRNRNLPRSLQAWGSSCLSMDDGWFHNRNLDNARLGDWFPIKPNFQMDWAA
ncbi:MAG: alpha-galactosidase [Anaerolineales bacterium]|nr:alpha-galactosidase [Anaerolineales bacterium]